MNTLVAEKILPWPTVIPAFSRRRMIGEAGTAALLAALFGVGLGVDGGKVAALPTGSVALPSAAAPPAFALASDADHWQYQAFRNRYVSPDGRVIDTGNGDVSHTEGQGLGMLFAVMFDDRAAFDSIYEWTRQNLARNEDALYSWRYDPNQLNHVADTNNASDGDIFIASALWRAGFRWKVPAYIAAARTIARDILRLLVVQAGHRTLLLPAKTGFNDLHSVTVNLSYYCFPALWDLARAVPSPIWAALEAGALELIDRGRFGKWMLPPDWLTISLVDGTLAPSGGRPARFSYDAIRIPLYLSWAHITLPAVQKAFASFWNATAPAPPAWVDLKSAEVAPYGYSPGMRAVQSVAFGGFHPGSGPLLATIEDAPDYFSASLTLLSRLICGTRGVW